MENNCEENIGSQLEFGAQLEAAALPTRSQVSAHSSYVVPVTIPSPTTYTYTQSAMVISKASPSY